MSCVTSSSEASALLSNIISVSLGSRRLVLLALGSPRHRRFSRFDTDSDPTPVVNRTLPESCSESAASRRGRYAGTSARQRGRSEHWADRNGGLRITEPALRVMDCAQPERGAGRAARSPYGACRPSNWLVLPGPDRRAPEPCRTERADTKATPGRGGAASAGVALRGVDRGGTVSFLRPGRGPARHSGPDTGSESDRGPSGASHWSA